MPSGFRQHRQQRLLRVQAVLGLVEDDRRGRSMTSSVTSSPRCAGRQCMKSAPARRLRHQRARSPGRARRPRAASAASSPGPSTSRRRCRRRRRRATAATGSVEQLDAAAERAHTRDALRARPAGSSKPGGDATRTCTPSITAACASDVATLLPSPTNAIVRPRSDAPPLGQRQAVGQRLAGMLLVGQRVDHAQPRRRRGERLEPRLRERADHDARRPSARGCARRRRSSRGRRARRPPAAR